MSDRLIGTVKKVKKGNRILTTKERKAREYVIDIFSRMQHQHPWAGLGWDVQILK